MSTNVIVNEKNSIQNNDTLNFYDDNASEFYKNTVNVNFKVTQNLFLSKLRKGATILDFGCGSGRDAKYFVDCGYNVDAIDGSSELCKLASEYVGIKVKNMLFDELLEVNKYDGVWACASILHLTINEIENILRKMIVATKNNGIIYISFKYGTFVGNRNGRFYTDMEETRFAKLFECVENVKIEEQWITTDVLPQRKNEKWFNVMLRKI